MLPQAKTEIQPMFDGVMYYPGRCPGQVCDALSGLKNTAFFEMRPLKTYAVVVLSIDRISGKCNMNDQNFSLIIL